jgi:hypothetical protein
MRTEAQRKDKYGAGYQAATVSLKVASRLSGMKTGFGTAVDSLVPKEQMIQGICNEEGVPTIQYPFYLNFGREIWSRIFKGIAGDALLQMAQAASETYTQKGLDNLVLLHIALDVFTLTLIAFPTP